MDFTAFLDSIRDSRHYREQIVHQVQIPAREASYGELSSPLPTALQSALDQLGIRRLYTHQVDAVERIREGCSVAIVTSTASGKTLCYNLPVLETLISQPDARALYLFPTKALAQDQHKSLLRLADMDLELAQLVRSGVYDGDTPRSTRGKLRDEGNILLSNPDMLHSGIMPYHSRWGRFFTNLKYVVIDEIHTYRGIFGSNVANVIRRLDRICEHYGSRPQYICCSATIANPAELASNITGRKIVLVDHDGSPKGPRTFVMWNPPLVDSAEMDRRSANVEAQHLMVELIRNNVQTIAFGRARIVAELMYRYVREDLQRIRPSLANAVRAYRGGYLPEERREIERKLFSGELMGVTSTNALELGIDVGGLDASIIIGFPGTIASTWQQAGRAGRGGDEALVVLVAYNDLIDQYLMRHPDYFLGQSPENALVEPENPYILANHLRCAAAELPLAPSDVKYFSDKMPDVARLLAEYGDLKEISGCYYWSQGEQPSVKTNLRTISDNTFTIMDTSEGNKVIGNVDAISAPELVYPEAIYMHEGETYYTESLDLVNKVAYVRKADVDYYTNPILDSSIRVDSEEMSKDWDETRVFFGDVTVTWATTAFKKIKFYSLDSIGYGRVDIPAQHLETTAMWLIPPKGVLEEIRTAGRNPMDGLAGIRNVAVHVLPFFAMCDKMDIGGIVDSRNTGSPTIFLYDRYKGGLGFAERGYQLVDELVKACLTLVEECSCDNGCPSCVGIPLLRPPSHTDPDVGAGGHPIPDKTAALMLLRRISRKQCTE